MCRQKVHIGFLIAQTSRKLVHLLKNFTPIFFHAFLLMLIVDLFFLRERSDLLIIAAIVSWTLSFTEGRIKHSVNFWISGIFFTFSLLSHVFQKELLAERFATWTYIFMLTGFLLAIYNSAAQQTLFVDIKDFILRMERPVYQPLLKIIRLLYSMTKYVMSFIFIFKPRNRKEKFRNLIAGVIMLIVAILIALGWIYVDKQQKMNAQKLFIQSLQPGLAYQSNYIIIKGRNFGLNNKKNARLMTAQGELDITWWTNEKILFQIPLQTRFGTQEVWIEKWVMQNGQQAILKSNKVPITILSRTDGWDEMDDKYFDQWKKLDEEVRILNGYSDVK